MANDLPILSERSRRILATLVREYIETGEPVASQVLVNRGGFGLSSATIRNVLAQLEELGYVRQPHTSAGTGADRPGLPVLRRHAAPASADARARPPWRRRSCSSRSRTSRRRRGAVMSTVPHLLAEASHHVAFALARVGAAAFDRIDFVPLGGRPCPRHRRRPNGAGHAQGRRPRRRDRRERTRAGRELPQRRVRGHAAGRGAHGDPRAARRRSACSTIASWPGRCGWRSTSLDDVGVSSPLFVEGASSLLDEVAEPHSGITLAALGTLVRMIEEKHRLVRLLTEYIDGAGPDGRHRHRTRGPDAPSSSASWPRRTPTASAPARSA